MQKNHSKNWKDVLSVDFSAESNKREEMKQTLLQQIDDQDTTKCNTKKEDFIMNQTHKRRFKRSSVIALAACLALVLSITAFAAVKFWDLGQHAHYISSSPDASDDAARMEESLPTELQGLLYDKNGRLIETIGEMENGIYNADGEAVMIINDESGNPAITTLEEENARLAQVTTLFDHWEDAKPYLAFDIHSFGYIPADYELVGYRIYNDENGQPAQDTKCLEMNFYKDGDLNDYIFVQIRYMDEETGFTTGGPDLKKITINGYEAMLDDSNVDILIDNVMYMIMAKNLPQEEVLKMAESLTK